LIARAIFSLLVSWASGCKAILDGVIQGDLSTVGREENGDFGRFKPTLGANHLTFEGGWVGGF